MSGNLCKSCKHEFYVEGLKYRCCAKFSKREKNKKPEKRDLVYCINAKVDQCKGKHFESK